MWISSLILLLLLYVPNVEAQQNNGKEIEILSASDSMTVEINLKPLGELSPRMRAILAFYAMRANGGCPTGGTDDLMSDKPLECPLTSALGLGPQCSDE